MPKGYKEKKKFFIFFDNIKQTLFIRDKIPNVRDARRYY